MGEFDEGDFEDKVREFEPLLWFAAKRFEVPGVLLKEDLYQEGLIALDETFDEHWELSPDSTEFTRAFKSRLFHRLSHELRHHKSQSRDWKKEVRDTIYEYSGEESSIFDRIRSSIFPPPDALLELEALQQYLDALESDLKDASLRGPLWGGSADDALEVLKIVTDPDYEVPDEVKLLYERVPTRVTNPLLSEVTGWSLMKVRRALDRLRKHARKLAPHYGILVPRDED